MKVTRGKTYGTASNRKEQQGTVKEDLGIKIQNFSISTLKKSQGTLMESQGAIAKEILQGNRLWQAYGTFCT
jgi:hypothetical protein